MVTDRYPFAFGEIGRLTDAFQRGEDFEAFLRTFHHQTPVLPLTQHGKDLVAHLGDVRVPLIDKTYARPTTEYLVKSLAINNPDRPSSTNIGIKGQIAKGFLPQLFQPFTKEGVRQIIGRNTKGDSGETPGM